MEHISPKILFSQHLNDHAVAIVLLSGETFPDDGEQEVACKSR